MTRLYWRFRGWWARVECRLRGYPPRPPLDDILRRIDEDQRDRMYLDLKGARERLCRTQTFVTHDEHRQALQDALDTIDRLGVFYAPDRWSKYDEPLLPGES